MKIMIDIPESRYRLLQKQARINLGREKLDEFAEAVLNGTPLEQEPCEDAISRILKRMWNCRGKHTTSIDKVKMEQIIRDELPFVNPKEDVLDKIRAEINKLSPMPTAEDVIDGNEVKDAIWGILIEVDKIIDKYRQEGE